MEDGDFAALNEVIRREEAQAKRKPELVATGVCNFCEVELSALLPANAKFCGVECQQGWEREEAARRRNHGDRTS